MTSLSQQEGVETGLTDLFLSFATSDSWNRADIDSLLLGFWKIEKTNDQI